jgi:hypothetical protein
MFVEGALKLIDFGIAKQVRPQPPTLWHSPRSHFTKEMVPVSSSHPR